MEIQRQSDYYSLDRPEIHRATLTAQQISDFTRGVRIPQGMMNTRTASDEDSEADLDDDIEDAYDRLDVPMGTRMSWREGEEWTYSPEDFVPEEEDVYEPNAEELDLEDELESRERYVPEDLVERRREGFRTANPALLRLLPLMGMGMGGDGGDGGGVLDQALGDVSGAESKAAFDRAAEEY